MKKIFLLLSLIPYLSFGQLINVGTGANDGTGDPLRTAFQKINAEAAKYAADSSKWVHFADTTTKIATKADVTGATLVESDPKWAADSAKKAPKASPTFTGTVTVPETPLNNTDAASKGYVDQKTTYSQVWVNPIADTSYTLLNGIPLGARYILTTNNHIYTSDGDNTWTDLGATVVGTTAHVDSVGSPFNYNGTAWVSIGSSSNHNSLSSLQGGTTAQYYHLTSAEHTVATQTATTSRNGVLSSTDWNTFYNKLGPSGSAASLINFPTLNQNTTGSAASLTTPRAIYGNNFDGSYSLTQVIASTYGGTGNAYTKFTGPTTSEKTFTLPNASATLATTTTVHDTALNYVPVTRTINGLPLSQNITINTQGGFESSYFFCDDILIGTTPVWHELEKQSDGGTIGSHTATTTSYVELDRYVTAAINSSIIPEGIWTFDLFCKMSAQSGQIEALIYRVNSSGTIVGGLLGTAESVAFSNTVTTGIKASIYIAEQTGWATTDRVGVIVLGKKIGSPAATLTFYHDKASGYLSAMQTPVTLLHNQMNGLNDGTQYLHLTQVEKTKYDSVRLLRTDVNLKATTTLVRAGLDSLKQPTKRLCAYYPNWSNDVFDQSEIPYDSLTHIFHCFVTPNANGTITPEYSGFDETGLVTNSHSHNIKILFSMGGGSVDANFRTISASASLRATFAHSIKVFMVTYNYDGVDIDWEAPGDATDRINEKLMIKAIRDSINTVSTSKLLSMAVVCDNYGNGFHNYDSLSLYVDFYNLMAYDFHQSGSAHSGPNAAIYPGNDPLDYHNIDRNLNYLLTTRSVPASKINLGLPFYGYEFTDSDTIYDGCDGSCNTNFLYYRQIQPDIVSGWTYHTDWTTETPYLKYYDDSKIIVYDDEASISDKVDYGLRKRSLGGVYMWVISGDRIAATNKRPLFESLYNTFRNNYRLAK
jgi:chitinase